MQNKHWVTATVMLLTLGAAGCATAASSTTQNDGAVPVQLAEPDARGVQTVSLSSEAAERLSILTQPVRAARSATRAGQPERTIPYAALVYDQDGKTWTYVTSHPLTYRRAPVTVDHIDGGTAYLSSGPSVGSAVVTTGSEELLGAEYKINGE